MEPLLGIHHITAIASDPQRVIDFYSRLLGLRLVKRTVNFDDPHTYHLYFGNELGEPGTVLTFFPWPRARRGRVGSGQVTAICFSVPAGSLNYWTDRLAANEIDWQGPRRAFDAPAIAFHDPDGLPLELVESGADPRSAWTGGPVDAEHAIRGFLSATMTSRRPSLSEVVLDHLGFRLIAESDGRRRYATGEGGAGAFLDLVEPSGREPGVVAAGTVHHIAWRTRTRETQEALRDRIASTELSVTPVLDRNYFQSIYFREPGDVLFEIATDPPGFLIDESPEALGTDLRLPSWLESRRSEIEGALPEIEVRR